MAGGGEKLTLNVAARYASYTNFGQSLEEFVHKSEVLRGHCTDVGRDFDSIVRSTNFNTVCEETASAVEDRLAWIRDHYRPFVSEDRLDGIAAMYRGMAGTPEQLVTKLRSRAEAGMGYAIMQFAEAAHDTTGIELFAREVIPALA